jgi:hypothetical protein
VKGKASTLETLRFTLELLKRIPRTHKVSAPELYRQLSDAGLERDLRTVQRQLDELAQHFDIERDSRSKPYGYQWKPAARGLSLPGLNEKESLLLTLAQQHLRNLLPAEVLASSAAVLRAGARQPRTAQRWSRGIQGGKRMDEEGARCEYVAAAVAATRSGRRL